MIASRPNSEAISQSVGNSFGTASVVVLQSFGIHHACSTCHLSGAFVSLLDVRHMLGELIIVDHTVHSLALLQVCWSIHLEVCVPSFDSVSLSSFSESASRSISRCPYHHLTRLTYCHSQSPLVDSCPGTLTTATIPNW